MVEFLTFLFFGKTDLALSELGAELDHEVGEVLGAVVVLPTGLAAHLRDSKLNISFRIVEIRENTRYLQQPEQQRKGLFALEGLPHADVAERVHAPVGHEGGPALGVGGDGAQDLVGVVHDLEFDKKNIYFLHNLCLFSFYKQILLVSRVVRVRDDVQQDREVEQERGVGGDLLVVGGGEAGEHGEGDGLVHEAGAPVRAVLAAEHAGQEGEADALSGITNKISFCDKWEIKFVQPS